MQSTRNLTTKHTPIFSTCLSARGESSHAMAWQHWYLEARQMLPGATKFAQPNAYRCIAWRTATASFLCALISIMPARELSMRWGGVEAHLSL